MKIECDRRIFLEAIQLVGGMVSTKESDSFLQHVKIKTVGQDSLELIGTDLEAGIKYILSPVQVENAGEILLPPQKISGILREVGDERFKLEKTESGCTLHCEGSTFKIVNYPSEDFPPMPEVSSKFQIEMDSLKLKEMIRRVVFSTAKESSRYTLNGILFSFKPDLLTLVATDGKRLALAKEPLKKGPPEEVKIIIPAKGLNHLEKIIAKEEKISLFFDNNHIVFLSKNSTLFFKLLEGRFPKFEDVIPKNCDKMLTCPKDLILSKVRQASLMTNEKSRVIRFSVSKGLLNISAHASNLGEALLEMKIDYQGDPIELGFNPDYLIDILKIWWSDSFS
ncbi:MAG: DNA polymerase III subunit beta, partial [Planctomycetota bacterium]